MAEISAFCLLGNRASAGGMHVTRINAENRASVSWLLATKKSASSKTAGTLFLPKSSQHLDGGRNGCRCSVALRNVGGTEGSNSCRKS